MNFNVWWLLLFKAHLCDKIFKATIDRDLKRRSQKDQAIFNQCSTSKSPEIIFTRYRSRKSVESWLNKSEVINTLLKRS